MTCRGHICSMPYREDGGGVADEVLMADMGFRRPDTTPCSLGRVFPMDRGTAECLWLSALWGPWS